MTVSQASLFLMTWLALRRTGTVLGGMALHWGLSDVFLMVRWGIMGLEQGDDHWSDINCWKAPELRKETRFFKITQKKLGNLTLNTFKWKKCCVGGFPDLFSRESARLPVLRVTRKWVFIGRVSTMGHVVSLLSALQWPWVSRALFLGVCRTGKFRPTKTPGPLPTATVYTLRDDPSVPATSERFPKFGFPFFLVSRRLSVFSCILFPKDKPTPILLFCLLPDSCVRSSLSGCMGPSLLCSLLSSCGERGLLSSCGAWASHCGGVSCWGTQALGTWAQ